ncbi:MAG: glycosyltransferase [Parasporobacterium sp.]|nr:glycosyltransferase [Parasporobacterium sp.]
MNTTVVIPAFDPDEKLETLVEELRKNSFHVIVVDDGSCKECKPYFENLDATVISNPHNMGKGAALKNGISQLPVLFPETDFFITADADGQHSVKDICRIREQLEAGNDFVLSVRRISRKSPWKSQIGNALSRFLFALANNRYLPDNQSGLRGFSIKHREWMLSVSGEKYDFEMNVLLIAEKQGIRVTRVPIETIYFNNNENSHFHPIKDTIRIYRQFFKTQIFAVISVLLNLIIVLFHSIYLGYSYFALTITVCWGIYAILCFVAERYTIFRKIRYTPGARRLIFSIFRYAIYILLCFFIGHVLQWPFIIAFIIALVLTAIMEFYVLKVAYD